MKELQFDVYSATRIVYDWLRENEAARQEVQMLITNAPSSWEDMVGWDPPQTDADVQKIAQELVARYILRSLFPRTDNPSEPDEALIFNLVVQSLRNDVEWDVLLSAFRD